jgi:hypothetical protein
MAEAACRTSANMFSPSFHSVTTEEALLALPEIHKLPLTLHLAAVKLAGQAACPVSLTPLCCEGDGEVVSALRNRW